MNRRDSLAALLALGAAAPAAVRGQQPKRVYLFVGLVGGRDDFTVALRAGLREQGWADGRDVQVEVRATTDDRAETEALARTILASRPDVVVATGAAAVVMLRVGATMPVVFAYSGDPVEAGLVKSLNRPGGNFTGMTWLSLELVGKRLEMLREITPQLRRVAVFANPFHPGEQKEKAASERAARAIGLDLRYYAVRDLPELEAAMASARGERCEALDVYPDAFVLRHRERIADFARAERMPSISGWREFPEAGLLASYGANRVESIRRLASYASRILRGAAPTDLPVELPPTIESVVNLRTAKALRVTIPGPVLIRADQVIE